MVSPNEGVGDMSGGRREGSGRKDGSTKGRVKVNLSLSSVNTEWLQTVKARGIKISSVVDRLLDHERLAGGNGSESADALDAKSGRPQRPTSPAPPMNENKKPGPKGPVLVNP